eukprot:TRINITY_DN12584_c2_g5_i2.p2 TRINITY_DN12584_c2_g5~~TRINITY_DN12584_c2_g5_i2.p2  ORF type:complete len:262 (+),score=43.63 TRINITY_DN12584_c2_g5_i2:1045-1830(+)
MDCLKPFTKFKGFGERANTDATAVARDKRTHFFRGADNYARYHTPEALRTTSRAVISATISVHEKYTGLFRDFGCTEPNQLYIVNMFYKGVIEGLFLNISDLDFDNMFSANAIPVCNCYDTESNDFEETVIKPSWHRFRWMAVELLTQLYSRVSIQMSTFRALIENRLARQQRLRSIISRDRIFFSTLADDFEIETIIIEAIVAREYGKRPPASHMATAVRDFTISAFNHYAGALAAPPLSNESLKALVNSKKASADELQR